MSIGSLWRAVTRRIGQPLQVLEYLAAFFQQFVLENSSANNGWDPETGHQIGPIGDAGAAIPCLNPPEILTVGKITRVGQYRDENESILQLRDILELYQLAAIEKYTAIGDYPDPVVGFLAVQ